MKELQDTRIYRALYIGNQELVNDKNLKGSLIVKPYVSLYSYAGDYHESPIDVLRSFAETSEALNPGDSDGINKLHKETTKRLNNIRDFNKKYAGQYTATMSMIHPYALIRLYGTQEYNSNVEPSMGNYSNTIGVTSNTSPIVDKADKLHWYESDVRMSPLIMSPDSSEGSAYDKTYVQAKYAKNPTTKDLINWSTYDKMGRFPYSFQDFVFCKYWNKIENNRLITLRRYPAPILDNVIPANYKSNDSHVDIEKGTAISTSAFPPVATAVTYFGEGTDNSIKDLLKFSVGYNWSELKSDVHNTSSNQIEEGKIFNDAAGSYLNTGLGALAIMLGVMGDYSGKNQISPEQIAGLPPDPYHEGPYENRVIGPVNVIMNVQKRERGLKFSHDSLVLTFDYIARPIAHVNNKAILLDLLANILAMCYSSGTWFGGAHRYRNESPATYPWRNVSSLNKIYQGKLFGKNGAFNSIFKNFFNAKTMDFATNFASDIIDAVKSTAKDIVNAIKGGGKSSDNQNNQNETSEEAEERQKAENRRDIFLGKLQGTAGRVVAAHLMKGQQMPWLQGARALLTGEPVGDWHITIGNPLNPIAMIGNLIVDNCEIEFYDELGPDDFPIGFKARITLKHGMGRDKDAIESMFNRGNGRIYMLSDAFKTSADYETTVDAYTGKNNPLKDQYAVGQWGRFQTTGSWAITAVAKGELSNTGKEHNYKMNYNPELVNFVNQGTDNVNITNLYLTTPWAMHNIL